MATQCYIGPINITMPELMALGENRFYRLLSLHGATDTTYSTVEGGSGTPEQFKGSMAITRFIRSYRITPPYGLVEQFNCLWKRCYPRAHFRRYRQQVH